MAPCLSIVPQETTLPTAGGTLTLKVNFTNFSTFSGWDIAIKTNVAILKPTSITLVETFLGTNETFSNCVNGVGAGCSGKDGAGVAHSSVVALGASDAGNGTLFTITYSVVAGPSTDVTYVNFPPAEDSSVSDPSGATIVDCGVTPNQCLTSSATVADFPDFLISANPVSVATRVGLAGTSTVAVSPVNGFTDDVVLAADNSACTITPMTIIGGSGTSTLSCTFTTAGTTTVTATGTSGSLSHSALVTYTVTGLPDFTISANPTAASIAVGTAGISTITISPLKAFTGDVALSADNDACTLTPTSVSGGSGKSTLSCTFATTGIVTVTVTGTSGSLTHSTKATFSLSTLAVTMSCPLTGTVGATVSCNATGSGGTSPRTFAWTATSGSPSSGIGSSFSTSYSIAGTYAISVIVTDSSSPPNSQTQSTTVTISTLTGPPSLGPCPVNPTPPPNSVPCLNISPQTQSNLTPGSTVTVSVTTTNMPTFSGWDIAIKTNNAVFNPQSLTVMETFGGTFQATTNCINGSGLGCSGNDGAGIAHVTLFTITYRVVSGPTTDITYANSPSEPSSVTDPSGFTLVDCGATPNQCLTGSATVSSLPDFSIFANPVFVTTRVGVAGTSTITVSPSNGFIGDVALTSDNSACTLTPPTATGAPGTSTLSCTFTIDGTVTVTVTGTIGSLTHSTTVTISTSTVSVQSLAATTNQKTVFQFPSERAMFYAQGRTWIFFTSNQNGVVIPVYSTSSDGQTWAQYSIISVAGTSTNTSTPISAITNGTHVFLVYYQGSYGFMSKPIVVGIGRLNSDGTIAWNSAITAVAATPGQRWYDPNSSLNADGTLFLSYRNATSTDGGGFVFASLAVPPYTSWSSPFTLRASADTWRTSWINLNNGQEYVLYHPAGGCLHGRLYNGGFGSEETICNTRSTRYIAFGFDNGSNTPTVIYQESNTERLIITYRVNGIWQTPIVIGYAETNSLPQWTVTFVASLAKYYLIYYNYTTGTIWDYNGNANSWSTRTLLVSSVLGNSSMSIISYPVATELTTQDMIGFAWTDRDPSTNRVVDIDFGAITVDTGPTTTGSLTQLPIQSSVHFYQPSPYLPLILVGIVATTLNIAIAKRKR